MGQTFWNVPHRRNESFTGREVILAELRAKLAEGSRVALAQAISGLGGIGKTQVAVEYAYRHEGEYRAIIWLNAESSLALKSGCSEVAREMGLPHQQEDLDQALRAVKLWLAKNPGWLLILDNADEPAILEELLPHSLLGHALITSRANNFQSLGIHDPVEMPNLPQDEAISFLLRRCRREQADEADRTAAADLARELDGLPLALEQAAAYIVDKKASFRQYLASYRERGLKLLEQNKPEWGRYNKSVINTWAANFEEVQRQSRAAADILRFSAFLAPDDIPFELLVRAALMLGEPISEALSGAEKDPLLIKEALQPLSRLSLIKFADPEKESYSLHRLVQGAVKGSMDHLTFHSWSMRSVHAARAAFTTPNFNSWAWWERSLPHALEIATEISRQGIRTAESGLLLNSIGLYMEYHGEFKESISFFKRSVHVLESSLGEDHPDYADSLDNLGAVYHETGRYAEAEPFFRRALEIRLARLGEDHPSYATSLNNLASFYRATGRYAEAEPLFRRALEINRTGLGEDHPDYATTLNNLGSFYRETGRYAEAEPLYLRALEIRLARLGEDHPSYATSLNNLGGFYRETNRYTEAEPFFRRALEIRLARLGEDHPDYAASLNNLGGFYRATGRYAEAENLFRRALEILLAGPGEDHPGYVASLINLGGFYRATGRYAEAENLFKEAAGILRSSLGRNHPNYRAVARNYVSNQREGGLQPPDPEIVADAGNPAEWMRPDAGPASDDEGKEGRPSA